MELSWTLYHITALNITFKAIQMTENFIIMTVDEVCKGETGDYICWFPDGKILCVKSQNFHKLIKDNYETRLL